MFQIRQNPSDGLAFALTGASIGVSFIICRHGLLARPGFFQLFSHRDMTGSKRKQAPW
jgi:hypothetical protein